MSVVKFNFTAQRVQRWRRMLDQAVMEAAQAHSPTASQRWKAIAADMHAAIKDEELHDLHCEGTRLIGDVLARADISNENEPPSEPLTENRKSPRK